MNFLRFLKIKEEYFTNLCCIMFNERENPSLSLWSSRLMRYIEETGGKRKKNVFEEISFN